MNSNLGILVVSKQASRPSTLAMLLADKMGEMIPRFRLLGEQ